MIRLRFSLSLLLSLSSLHTLIRCIDEYGTIFFMNKHRQKTYLPINHDKETQISDTHITRVKFIKCYQDTMLSSDVTLIMKICMKENSKSFCVFMEFEISNECSSERERNEKLTFQGTFSLNL